MISDHANPIRVPPPIGPPELVVRPLRSLRSCVFHPDCDVADARALRQGAATTHVDDALDLFFR